MGRGSPDAGFTGWFWTAAVSAVLALVPAVLAVRLVRAGPRWAAGTTPRAPRRTAEREAQPDPERDLWHALDEGRDPTDTEHRA